MKATKQTPEYFALTISQHKKAWIGSHVDGFYYAAQRGDRVLMFTKYICAN